MQARGLFSEPLELVLPEFVFVIGSAPVDVLCAKLQQAVDQTGELVRPGGAVFSGRRVFDVVPGKRPAAPMTQVRHQVSAPCQRTLSPGESE